MAEHSYKPESIEDKWQQYWEDNKVFEVTSDLEELKKKPKYYVLDMFPYPSGAGLHVGHPKGYTATDVIARMKRMQGFNVLHPMGWDAFGLPAERAAVRDDIHPAIITERNIANYKRQIKMLGFSYDWTREINTSKADYYKWSQWIFLQLFKRDLAYIEDVPVNWCPALGTVLANEEVKDGVYIETGDPVERRLMKQWMLKITAYAQRLIDDLADLDWPDSLKEMQRNWIGRSEGAEIDFAIDGHDAKLRVFTTRPDTIFGATYMVVAPEHKVVDAITTDAQRDAVQAYRDVAKNKSDMERTELSKEKTGVFTGAYAINPATGQPIPIWIADYVLASYGTGAIMAVPGQDERDWEFAEVYDLPIVRTVQPPDDFEGKAFTGEGAAINSGFLDGMGIAEAKTKIIDWLEAEGSGERTINYKLRDWLFARQRYWGEPFPIIHMDDGSVMAVPEADLPVVLPQIDEYKPTDDGRPPLARAGDEWLMVTLPDGRVGMRDMNTMPQWAGSCWYYLRYIDPTNAEEAWDKGLEDYWMPVDLYVGGAEHAVLHLLYSRFWHKVLYDCGVVSTKEPFQQLFNQGMIQAPTYKDERGRYYYLNDVQKDGDGWKSKSTNLPLSEQIEKMSKSKLNGYLPDDVIAEYGVDSTRLYELFIGPLSASAPWQMAGLDGMFRFLGKVWRLMIDEESGEIARKVQDVPASSNDVLNRLLHKTIMGVEQDVKSIDKMNTAISKMMIFANAATSAEIIPLEIARSFTKVIAPFAPHMAEEIWQRMGETDSISYAEWPTYDVRLTVDDTVKMPLQVNGKVRDVVEVSAETSKDELEAIALANERVQKFIDGKPVRKVIVVPKRMVNIVV